MKPSYPFALVTITLLFLLSACSNPTRLSPTQVSTKAGQVTAAAPATTAYPAPDTVTGNSAYPGPSAGLPGYADPAYPAPSTPTQNPGMKVKVTPFKFDTPLVGGTTTVTGVGPAGVPIILVDVTFNGEIISQANITIDGKFTFSVTPPLEKGHRLGIALGDLKGTSWVEQNFEDPGFQGTQPQLVPSVGFFYDTTTVK